MIQPNELKLSLPVELSNGVTSTTVKVWKILAASKKGDLNTVKKMAAECPELMYAQYNYAPPIHFAVREGHISLVRFLLAHGAHDPRYKTYPFQETLTVVAQDRGCHEIAALLDRYADDISLHAFKGARVPDALKWAQFYYLEHDDGAAYILEKGMNPDTMSWHHVTVLHDMAQKGNLYKAELLVKYGADLNPVDEEYRSTPLGIAARWGHHEMVQYLLQLGAAPHKASASWATPLA